MVKKAESFNMSKNILTIILDRFHKAAPPFEVDGPMLGAKEFDIFKAGYFAAIEDAKIKPCDKKECAELYVELLDKRIEVRKLNQLKPLICSRVLVELGLEDKPQTYTDETYLQQLQPKE